MPLAIQKHAAAEARTVLALVKQKMETVESARELISVPPDVEQELRRFISEDPDEKRTIEEILEFRAMVAAAFEQLIAGGGVKGG